MQKKKQPSDYPQLTFRVSQEDKKCIAELVDEITNDSNKSLEPTDKLFRKNDVYVDALYLGLLTLKKKAHRLRRN